MKGSGILLITNYASLLHDALSTTVLTCALSHLLSGHSIYVVPPATCAGRVPRLCVFFAAQCVLSVVCSAGRRSLLRCVSLCHCIASLLK